MEGIRPLVGHNINLLIVMRFVKSNDAKSEGCSLVWQEVTNKWYVPYDKIYNDF